VEELTCRLLPYTVADGPTNMATDEALLESALAGVATLRFYGWSEPTLSLGYFQSHTIRLADPLLAELPFVRRPSGGDTLVQHHELTYALALPRTWLGGRPWLVRMHENIREGLASFGVAAHLFEPVGLSQPQGPLCFHHCTPGDLMIGQAKVVGSALRKRRGALLQHGGILLARSHYTPTLPGIRELTGRNLAHGELARAVTESFAAKTAARMMEAALPPDEAIAVERLKANKYCVREWNCKR